MLPRIRCKRPAWSSSRREAGSRAHARGATLIEYLIGIGLVGLLCMVGLKKFGGVVSNKTEEAARCLADFSECDTPPSASAKPTPSEKSSSEEPVTLTRSKPAVSPAVVDSFNGSSSDESSLPSSDAWNGTQRRRSGPFADDEMDTGVVMAPLAKVEPTSNPDDGAGAAGAGGNEKDKPWTPWPPDPKDKPGGTGPCDRELSRVFGSADTIAAGSGYEPGGFQGSVAKLSGLDRSEAVGPMPNNWGHLFGYAMHIYAVPGGVGVGQATLYIPPGFTKHTPPNGKDGVALFYYPKLMGEKNVTLAVYHVDDFRIDKNNKNAAGSIRIGMLGGPGGDGENYIHSHLEVYRGWGLPSLKERDKTRLFFPAVFCSKP